MNGTPHYGTITHLEQHPELLEHVEALNWQSINGESSQRSDSDAQTEANLYALDWPEPEALGGELPPVPAFDTRLLPFSLRPLVEDTAERMQVPLDFPAVTALLCLAGVTNRRAAIQPKSADTSWVVVPNLWGGIIAPPGLMKSPVISAITRPLLRIEADWRAQYTTADCAYKQKQEESKLRHSAWQDRCKANFKKDMDPPPRPVDDEGVGPTCKRLITQDATFESLHALMSENPAGIFVIRDELTGWLAGLERQGREGERAFYLQAWNGDSSFTIDRIGRGSVQVEACCVSILGGIQPSRLRAYLADALKDGPSNDGLMQRFQMLVYPDISGDWQYVDRAPNSAASRQAEQTYYRLVNTDITNRPVLCFAPDAQALFVEWLTELEGKVRDNNLHPALVSHLAKYRSLMPSLALLFELADGVAGAVSLAHAQQSAAWCDYLEGHARRIYAMLVSPERRSAAELGRRLLDGWKREEGLFTVRDVYQNDWRDLSTPDAVRGALSILRDSGWVRRVELDQPTKGRPSEIYLINPKVARRPE